MATNPMRVGVYPGSFNPFTVAHLAIAEAAREDRDLDRLHLAISRTPLGKDTVERPTFEHRVQVLAEVVARYDWLDLVITSDRLLADIAEGYDLLVMGADKWHQIHELSFYADDAARRDAALGRLPEVAVAPRPPAHTPPELELDVAKHLGDVSSTGARNGNTSWMHDAARRFADRTGAWIDPDRYEAFLAEEHR